MEQGQWIEGSMGRGQINGTRSMERGVNGARSDQWDKVNGTRGQWSEVRSMEQGQWNEGSMGRGQINGTRLMGGGINETMGQW